MDLNNEESGMLILRMAHFLNLIPCVKHWPMFVMHIVSLYSPMKLM